MTNLKVLSAMVAAIVLLWAGRTTSARASDMNQTNVTVELLIFSGRPNPVWQFQSTGNLKLLKEKLKNAPEAFKEEPAGWTRLGFAGFRIHGGEVFGLPNEMRIYQGVIMTGHGKDAKYVKDSTGLEQVLFKEAGQQPLEKPVKDEIARHQRTGKTQ
jgi:hypothetical protein